MLDSNDALINEFVKRGKPDKVAFYTAMMIFDSYYTMNKDEWLNQENQEYRKQTELRFSQYYKKYKIIWESVPINDKMAMSNEIRSRSVMEGMKMETITIEQWLNHIEKLENEK